MLSSVLSCGLSGIDGFEVTVEVNLANGMPMFEIVGLPDASVKESRERVRAAIRNSGYAFPAARLTVNLAPADTKKEGPAFDLPIALATLCCLGILPPNALNDLTVFGELSLDGSVRPVRGALPMVISALERGKKHLMLPMENLNEVRCIEGISLYPVETLQAAIRHLTGQLVIQPPEPIPYAQLLHNVEHMEDFKHVKGQSSAKRALEIAAAGGHNVLLIGPPGSGKTLMARCMPSILPDMTFSEALETTRIHSVAGTIPPSGLLTERPFRSPHHTASHRFARVAGRRRQQRPARRNQQSAQWNSVFGRVTGIPARRTRSAAPAAGGRICDDHARERAGNLSFSICADCLDESVSMWKSGQPDTAMPVHAHGNSPLSRQDLRASPRSNRYAHRG